MTNQYNELDLVEDFVQVSERFVKDMKSVFNKSDFKNFTVCVMPRSKRESKYKQSKEYGKKRLVMFRESDATDLTFGLNKDYVMQGEKIVSQKAIEEL